MGGGVVEKPIGKKFVAMSAFVLSEDGTWIQPSFWVPETEKDDHEIYMQLLRQVGRDYFIAFGLQEDPDAEDDPDYILDIGYGVPR